MRIHTPGFSAEAALFRSGNYLQMQGADTRTWLDSRVTMAAQCCPPGFDTTGCTQPRKDCTTTGCRKGLVCCDCTVTHCTTPAQCKHECSQ